MSGAGMCGYECTIAVESLAKIAATVEANGGRVTLAEVAIPGVGRLIKFTDSEDNVVCAMCYDEGHR